jgi:hypothetical protein
VSSIPQKITSLPKTISIPKSLSQTQKLVDDKAKVKNEAEEKPTQNQALQPVEQVVLLTQEMLDLAMPRIRSSFQDAGKSMELAILGQEMKIVDGQLVLEVMGQLQEDLADKMKSELIRMLREITKSTKVTIRLEVKEELQSNVNRLYTSTDKLNHLKTIHPALSEFQKRFGLETDF